MKKIISLTVERIPDYDADLSYLGTFSDKAETPLAIDYHKENGASFRTFRYFNPQPGTCENKEQAMQTYNRLMDYERGNWSMLCVRAVAEILTSQDGKAWKSTTIKSPGLYGVESDMNEQNFKEIENEQIAELVAELQELGFSQEDIANAKN